MRPSQQLAPRAEGSNPAALALWPLPMRHSPAPLKVGGGSELTFAGHYLRASPEWKGHRLQSPVAWDPHPSSGGQQAGILGFTPALTAQGCPLGSCMQVTPFKPHTHSHTRATAHLLSLPIRKQTAVSQGGNVKRPLCRLRPVNVPVLILTEVQ